MICIYIYIYTCIHIYIYIVFVYYISLYLSPYTYIYIYIYIHTYDGPVTPLGRGEDTVGNPRRARIYRFELILSLKLGKRLLVEKLEATVSQSTAPSTPPE